MLLPYLLLDLSYDEKQEAAGGVCKFRLNTKAMVDFLNTP